MKLEATYLNLPEFFFQKINPTPTANPQLVLLNDKLAAKLNIDKNFLTADYLSGNKIWPNSTPFAQAYAGHQFGYFNLLGDGRAHILGELTRADGSRLDIQLKGSGTTMFSRRGDGRAALGPMVREFIIAPALAGLGIPATQSLAVVKTGETVMREQPSPGGILTRIAASHLRVGTFEFAAARGGRDAVQALADYAIKRHYPHLTTEKEKYLLLLQAVIAKQAELVAQWMNVGFIHGVMNTDNMTISGESIDFGPCAFMDEYDPQTVFSSIDRQGRYAFSSQPPIAQWNLARLAECLLPLLSLDEPESVSLAEKSLAQFADIFSTKYFNLLRGRLGLDPSSLDTQIAQSEEAKFFEPLFLWMLKFHLDYNDTFRKLCYELPIGGAFDDEEFLVFKNRWLGRLNQQGKNLQAIQIEMKKTNPVVIARNYYVEEAISNAVERNDFEETKRLVAALANPFEETAENLKYRQLRPGHSKNYQTFCGT